MHLEAKNTILFIALLAILSCSKNEAFDEVPKIEFIGLNRDSITQSNLNQDSLVIIFGFQDGGNNLGSPMGSNEVNVFIRDPRIPDVVETAVIPDLPALDDRGVEGEIEFTWRSTCCIFPDGRTCAVSDRYPYEEIRLEIQIMDRDSNMSNVITTGPIILKCE